MFKLYIFITVLGFTIIPNLSFSQETKTNLQKEGVYVILSSEKFAAIKAEMEKQADWSPILIEGFPKNELVAFYIQSYEDSTILSWVDLAYKKIHSFENTKPEAHQERKMQKSKLLPRTRENMHAFMMLLTTEQIEVIGFK